MHRQLYAFLSGFCAALASVSGKLALNGQILRNGVCRISANIPFLAAVCDKFSLLLQLILAVLVVICNGLMWTFLSKAMSLSDTTGEAVALSSAFNFLLTSGVGIVFFQERITLNWCIGMVMALIGLFCINLAARKNYEKPSSKCSKDE